MRSSEPEQMDSDVFDDVLAAQSFRFIERVNRRFGGIRVVRDFVRAEADLPRDPGPLRVLDVGSGSCDIPAAVCRAAARDGVEVAFSCVEWGAYAVDRARERLAQSPDLPVRVLREDIFAHRPAAPYDAAVGSMVFHHLSDAEILRLLGHLRTMVRGGILINDLERCGANYLGAHLLCLAESAGVRHDATVSVKRGFRVEELRRLLEGLRGETVSVRRRWPFRIAAVIRPQSAYPHPGALGGTTQRTETA